ncbi:hypothetical protein J437_LFUL017244, partial [Ladona fulva]
MPCLKSKLKNIIYKLGSKHSPGIDKIPNFLPAASYEFICSPLLQFYWHLLDGFSPTPPIEINKLLLLIMALHIFVLVSSG